MALRSLVRTRLPLLILAMLATGRADAGFYLQDLGVLPNPVTGQTVGQSSSAIAINTFGQIAGEASTAGNSTAAAKASSGGSFQSVGVPAGAFSSVATSINGNGDVAGSFVDANDGYKTHAFVSTSAGGATDLGTIVNGGGNTQANGINGGGQVAGTGRLSDGSQRAFVASSGGSMSVIGPLGSGLSDQANGINDKGIVVGASQVTPGGSTHAFICDTSNGGTTAVDLTSLHSMSGFGQNSFGTAINTAGYVAGYADYNGGGQHAFLTSPTVGSAAIDIGVLGGATSSYAYGLNDFQQVVGGMNDNAAFIWDPVAGLFDLNTLLSPAGQKAWTLETAYGINDAGQIVGVGYSNADHALHGFLLTPVAGESLFAPFTATVPAPPTLVLSGLACVIGLGVAGLGKARRGRTGAPATAGPAASSPGR